MDELLKRTADAGVEVSAAEAALEDDDPGTAREALERAEVLLQELRERWPSMSAAERTLVGRAAGTVRGRMDAAKARVPVRRALSEGAPERDPEQEQAPEGPEVPPAAPAAQGPPAA